MARISLEELESNLDQLRTQMELPLDGRGKCYVHLKTGDHYVAKNVGYREADMVIEVVYHPLRKPGVLFHRPFTEFAVGYKPVKHPQA